MCNSCNDNWNWFPYEHFYNSYRYIHKRYIDSLSVKLSTDSFILTKSFFDFIDFIVNVTQKMIKIRNRYMPKHSGHPINDSPVFFFFQLYIIIPRFRHDGVHVYVWKFVLFFLVKRREKKTKFYLISNIVVNRFESYGWHK